MRSRTIAGYIGLSLLWGSDWLLAAWLRDEPALLVFALRFALAALLLLPWALRGRIWRTRRPQLVHSVVLGLAILCLPELLIVVSAQRIGSVLSLFALAAVPVLLAISGRGTIPTAVCGMAGVLFLSRQGVSASLAQLPWLLCPLAAALVLAWGLVRAESADQSLSVPASLCLQCGVASLVFAVASQLFESEPIDRSSPVLASIALTAVVTTVGAYLLFYWLLPRLGAARMSTLQWTQTLVATIESAIAIRLAPGWESVLGAVLILIAVFRALSTREDPDRPGVILQITQR